MGGPIGPNQPRTVNGKAHRQPLQGHIMHHLIISALQEGGINRAKRFEATRRHPSSKGHGMLLGNAYIEHPRRKPLGHLGQAGAIGHRGGYGDDAVIARSLGDKGLTENARIGRRARLGFGLCAGSGIEFRHPMPLVRSPLGGGIALAFDGADMDQNRPRGPRARGPQHREELRHIMAINRSDILKPKLLKERARTGQSRHQLPRALGAFPQRCGQRRLEPFGEGRHARQRLAGIHPAEIG